MKQAMKYGFTSLWIIAMVIALFVSRNWNATTGLFPHVVGYPLVVLLIAILVLDIRGKTQSKDGDGEACDGETEAEFSKMTGRVALYFVWLVGFVVLVWAIGIVYTVPVYVFTYLKFQAKYSWLKSGIYAASAVAFILLLFNYIFEVGWPDGAVQHMLGL
jgi:uncharacterized protein YqhQ